MRTRTLALVLCVVSLLLAGCASVQKTIVPYTGEGRGVPTPVLQKLLADAAGKAVAAAVEADGWKGAVRGKRVVVEIQGVMPMGSEDLLSFVRGAVEAEFARAGAIVGSGGLAGASSGPDYRVVVNLGFGGIDAARSRELDHVALLVQSGVMLGGVGLGLGLGFGAEMEGYAAIPAGIVLLGGAAWMVFDPPIRRDTTLTARVALSIYLLQQSSAGSFWSLAGQGEEVIVIPDTPRGPYRLLDDRGF
jgi:uncharacterized protein YceK